MGSNSMIRQKTLPTRAQVDDYLDKTVASNMAVFDGNDLAYALDASWDYDPSADLGKIRVPLLAINSADDLINPPELGTLEAGVKKVPHGRSIVIPLSDETVGHGTHTKAILWKQYVVEVLKQTE
jgi:homoserine O-acetyltransferase